MTNDYKMRNLLGRSEIRKLEAEGWCFSEHGTRLGDCYSVWSQHEETKELKIRFLADPETYPNAWPEDAPAQPDSQPELALL